MLHQQCNDMCFPACAGLTEAAVEAAAAALAPAVRPLGSSRGASSSSLSAAEEALQRNGHDPSLGAGSADDASWPSLGSGRALLQGEPLGGLPKQAQDRGSGPRHWARGDGQAERVWPGPVQHAISSQEGARGANDAWPQLGAAGAGPDTVSNGHAHARDAVGGAADAAWGDQPARAGAGAGPHDLQSDPGSQCPAETLSEAASRSASGSQAAADGDDDEGLGESADLFNEAAGPELQWSAPAPARPADPLAPWGGYGAGPKRGARVKGKGAGAAEQEMGFGSYRGLVLDLSISFRTTAFRACLPPACTPVLSPPQ